MAGRFGESSNNNTSLSIHGSEDKVNLSDEFGMLVDDPTCYTRKGSVQSTKPVGDNLAVLAPNGGGRFGESSMASNSYEIDSTKVPTDLKSDFKLLSENPECYKRTGLPGTVVAEKEKAPAPAVKLVKKLEPATVILPESTDSLTKEVIEKVKKIKDEVEVSEPASAVPTKALEKAKEKEDKAPEVAADVSKVISEVTTDTVVKTVIEAAASTKKTEGTKMYHLGTKYKPHLMGTGDPMKVKYCYGLAVTKNEASTDVETWMCPANDSLSCPTALTSQCKRTLVTSIPHSLNVSGTTENATFFNY